MAEPITLHGIANCDTVRKARRWLDAEGIEFSFHDFRKDGLDAAMLEAWIACLDDWESLINRRGTTWRKLDDATKVDLDQARAVAMMVEHPAVIKRPVLVRGKDVLIGFDEARYRAL